MRITVFLRALRATLFPRRMGEPLSTQGKRAPLVERIPFDRVSRDGLPMPKHFKERAEFHFQTSLRSGTPVFFGCTPGMEWVDVYTRKRRTGEKDGLFTGDYARFGYSVSRPGWSYGEGPPAAREIRDLMDVLVAHGVAGK